MININQFALLAMKNKNSINFGQNAGCFHCMNIFPITEIKEYTDNGQTVVCPKCNVDSVVGDSCGFVLTTEELKKANAFWYKK